MTEFGRADKKIVPFIYESRPRCFVRATSPAKFFQSEPPAQSISTYFDFR